MPKGPSIEESKGVATLEGKLRLGGTGIGSGGPGVEATAADFECAITATVCLKINNFTFSGSRVEAVNFNQRLSQSQYGVMAPSETSSVTKHVVHTTYAKNLHFRFA